LCEVLIQSREEIKIIVAAAAKDINININRLWAISWSI
jgi:hypothetical protein